jgi:hypothetical protein
VLTRDTTFGLFRRVLLFRLEADRLADESFQFDQGRGLLVEHALHHHRRGQHQHAARLELAHRAGDLAEDLVTDGLRRLDGAAPRAVAAGFAQLALEALGGALARHLHQAQRLIS